MKYCGWACTQAAKKFTPAQRLAAFLSRIEKRGDGCWIHKGATDKWGYTHLGVEGKRVQAHRYAYEVYIGPIPAGKLIMHTCDVPACVNPDHLRIGTDAENVADMYAKDRDQSRGDRNLHAKLTEAQAKAILALKDSGYFKRGVARALAEEHGVGIGTIHAIWRRHTWKHIQ
jgi:hypothetical protein